MANTTHDHPKHTGGSDDRHNLAQVQRILQQEIAIKVTGSHGEEATLPPRLVMLLQEAVEHLARNERVTLVTTDQTLTTQEAADLLNMSRPHLIKLLDEGALPFTKVGTHRRLRVADVLTFKQDRAEKELEGLAEIARLSQEMGLYDA